MNSKLYLKHETRHWDDVFRLMSWWDADRIAAARVMVVGAGALGNEVLKNLALLNVGHILIVDFDTVEYSNLSRSVLFREHDVNQHLYKSEVAATRIKEINPNIRVMTIKGDIGIDVGLGLIRRMDVVIGCLDNRLARLAINRHCFRVNKVWVDGAIENLAGQLNVYKPGVSCYECQLTNSEWDNIRFKMGCPDVARRNKSVGRIATTPIAASIIGAMQVQEALKIIFDNIAQSMAGQTFQYEGMNNMILLHQASALKETCDSHYLLEDIVEAQQLSHRSTLLEVFSWSTKQFNTPTITIQLDHEVVLEICSDKTESTHPLIKAKPHLSDDFLQTYHTDPEERFFITQELSSVDDSFDRLDLELSELGIPPLHIIQVETEKDIYFVELTGDLDYLAFK